MIRVNLLQPKARLPETVEKKGRYFSKSLAEMTKYLQGLGDQTVPDHVLRRAKRIEGYGEDLVAAATIDTLTGLYNRRAIVEKAKIEERRVNKEEWISVICLDLDGFKQVNDTYGHEAGDRVLKRMGDILRQTDIAGRYGGDEFVVLLANTDYQGACRVEEKIRTALDEAKKFDRLLEGISYSVGINSERRENFSFEDSLKKADALMYKQKEET